MNEVNIKSENQSGGITAQHVNYAKQKGEPVVRRRSGKALSIVIGIATLIATIVAVLTYFGLSYQ